MCSALSKDAQIAQLNINILELQNMNRMQSLQISDKIDEVLEVQLAMIFVEKKYRDERKAMEMHIAELTDEKNRARKAHAELAESIVNRNFEKELKAIGATDRLRTFRENREQRRRSIKKVFSCAENVEEEGSEVRETLKRHQDSDKEYAICEEMVKEKRIEMELDRLKRLMSAEEFRNANEITRRYFEHIIEEENKKNRKAESKSPKPVPEKEKETVESNHEERSPDIKRASEKELNAQPNNAVVEKCRIEDLYSDLSDDDEECRKTAGDQRQ